MRPAVVGRLVEGEAIVGVYSELVSAVCGFDIFLYSGNSERIGVIEREERNSEAAYLSFI